MLLKINLQNMKGVKAGSVTCVSEIKALRNNKALRGVKQ